MVLLLPYQEPVMSDPSPAPKRSKNNSAKSKIKIAADQFLIAGIGASAGGIQALKDLFSQDGSWPYVRLLHQSLQHDLGTSKYSATDLGH